MRSQEYLKQVPFDLLSELSLKHGKALLGEAIGEDIITGGV